MTSRKSRIKAANALTATDFIDQHIKPSAASVDFGHDLYLSFATAATISNSDFEGCFDLVRSTSAAAYTASSRGWSSEDKRTEMRDADMKYLMIHAVARAGSSSDFPSHALNFGDRVLDPGKGEPGNVVGFLSFMLTREDRRDVIYCYEVHLKEEYQRRGLGGQLMLLMERVGVSVAVKKGMLTVFTSNEAAIRFYNRIGYEWYDEEAVPEGKSLRSGVTEPPKPSYVILAKNLNRVK